MVYSGTAFMLAVLGGIVGYLAGQHIGYRDAYKDLSQLVYMSVEATENGGLQTEKEEAE